jgi:hypothetical protein
MNSKKVYTGLFLASALALGSCSNTPTSVAPEEKTPNPAPTQAQEEAKAPESAQTNSGVLGTLKEFKIRYDRPNKTKPEMTGSVILDGKIIKKVFVTGIEGTPKESVSQFEEQLNLKAIGQSIDSLKLDTIGGQSLSTAAFEVAMKQLAS